MKNIYLLLFILLLGASLKAQQVSDFENVEAVTSKGFFGTYVKGLFKGFTDFGDPFRMNTGLGIDMRSYSAYGIENRQDPFFYSINANASIQIYKLNLPFSLMVTAKNATSSLPNLKQFVDAFKEQAASYRNRFVRVGASPYYKWMKLHLGHRNMRFSPLTMDNLTFFGIGTELNPGKVRIAAMRGRLAQAEPIDLSLVTPNIPVFKRTGWGVKLGYGDTDNFADFIVFNAKDDLNSIDLIPSLEQEVAGAENLVIGVNLQKTLFEKFLVKLELAGSAYSPDISQVEEDANPFPYPGFLFNSRLGSTFKKAWDATFQYNHDLFNIGLQYKRIDPDYRTLGAYFFNDDLENYTINAGWSMLAGKLSVTASGGFQQNNLEETKTSTMTRLIGSLNLAYNLEQLSLGLNYSNFTNDVAYLLNTNLDSLNVVVVTQDIGLTSNYRWEGKGGKQQNLNASFNIQQVTDDVLDAQLSSASKMLVGNLAYTIIFGESGWNLNSRVNFNRNMLSSMEMDRWGFGGGVSKNFLEGKLSTGLNFNYFRTTSDRLFTNNTFQSQLNASWQVSDSHDLNFGLGLVGQSKNVENGDGQSFEELTVNLGYNFRFSVEKKKKEGANE